MFALEALRARFGDALLLHFGTEADPKLAVIDGGPTDVFTPFLRPRLEEIRKKRQLADDTPLPIALMMVSHLDADHITGLLELAGELNDLRQNHHPQPWNIERFWLNTFDDLIGNDDPQISPAVSSAGVASLGDLELGGAITAETTDMLASVKQGRELRDLLNALNLAGNRPFKSLVMFGHPKNPVSVEGLELTVIGPDKTRLDLLHKDWDEKIKPLLKKKTSAARAEVAAYLDRSVYNLSSIVVLARHQGKSILLTGDARGDHVLAALKEGGQLDGPPLHVDILKLPHHGSDRNMAVDFFEKITADHYVISADGTHDNPDVPVLEWIARTRPDDGFTIHFTNRLEDFAKQSAAMAIAAFLEAEKTSGRGYGVRFPAPADRSVRIELI